MTQLSINSVFEGFGNLKVLIVGDVMIDSYVWGKVDRISPEAPVPIVNVKKKEYRLGGAANVALNVLALGGTPILCSMIGEDDEGTDFLKLMKNSNLSTDAIFRSSKRITTIKHRVICGSQQMLRIDSEIERDLIEEESELLIQKIKELLPKCDVIIFEDYDKGILTKYLIEAVIFYANEANIPTVVDPKRKNFLHYKRATLFKPNYKELKEGLRLDSLGSVLDVVKQGVKLLKDKLQVKIALITLSELGIFIDTSHEAIQIPAHEREISDVSGAGDTVISVAAMTLALKLSPKIIAAMSNLAGGLVCEHIGVVPINKNDLYNETKRLKILE